MIRSWRTPGKRPLIVAHRGSSCHAPENTLAAFRQAVADGADGIELDARLCRDGSVVVVHDAALGRVTTGAGLIRNRTLEELRRESAGRGFPPRFARERIPTLEEVLDEFGGRILLNIELKTSRSERSMLLADRCCALLDRVPPETILLSSFYHPLILRARKLRPVVPAGFLLHGLQMLGNRFPERWRDVDYLICAGAGLRRRFVERAHERGVRVGEFTVNGGRRLARCERFGIDALITDDPGEAKSFL
jgi:glycerophosphoryl diester phosphodiesterase